jgi:hypothetical protein
MIYNSVSSFDLVESKWEARKNWGFAVSSEQDINITNKEIKPESAIDQDSKEVDLKNKG